MRTPDQPKSPRRRRLWLVLAGLLFLLVIGLGGSYAWTRLASNRDLELALAETDKLDPYWRLEDIEARRRPLPPPKENGFEQALLAASLKPTGRWPDPQFPQFDSDPAYQRLVMGAMRQRLNQKPGLTPVLLCDEEARALRSELERARTFIVEARKMADLPNGHSPTLVPRAGAGLTVPPRYISLLDVAKMLGPDVRVRLYDGDISGALVDVRACLNISHALEEEPTLMAQLVLRVVDLLAVSYLETVLAGGFLSESVLSEFQKQVALHAEFPAIYQGMRGQRAYFDNLLERAQTGEISREQLQAELGPSTPGISIPVRLARLLQFMLLYGDLAGARASALHVSNELMSIGLLPPQERFKATQAFAAKAQTSASWWAKRQFGAPLYIKYFADELGPIAVQMCAITAIAVERFRLANNRWPDSLEELTPKYLKAVPTDPFSGKPLRFVRKGTVFIVYSIGERQRSDGGTVADDGSLHRPDQGFVLHDPAARRQPGPPFVFPERTSQDMKTSELPGDRN